MQDSCYPPHHTLSSKRVPINVALSLVSDYLARAESDPSLHPDAKLTENGPTLHSTGDTTGLVLHNLKRLRDGLNGEYYAAQANPQQITQDDATLGGEGNISVPHKSSETDRDAQMNGRDLGESEDEQMDEQGKLEPDIAGQSMLDRSEQQQVAEAGLTRGGDTVERPRKDKKRRKKDKKDRWKEQKSRKAEAATVNGTVED